MPNKFDRIDFEKRKEARNSLDEPHTPPKNVPELRERVYEIEKILGIVETPGG